MSMQSSRSDERATTKPVHLPTVLAVGCSDALLARCWNALAGLGVMVRDCEIEALPTLAATRQPLAIVMPSRLYARDADELAALARDVRATLIEVDEASGARDLEPTLSLVVRAARSRREGPSVTMGETSTPSARPVTMGETSTPSARPVTMGETSRPSARPASGRYSILPGDPIPTCPPVSGVQRSALGMEDLEEELLAAVR